MRVGVFDLLKRINGSEVLEDGLVVPRYYTAFSSNKKMVTILRRGVECKVEKFKHM